MTDLLVDTLHVTSVVSGSVAAHFKHKYYEEIFRKDVNEHGMVII